MCFHGTCVTGGMPLLARNIVCHVVIIAHQKQKQADAENKAKYRHK